MASEPAEAYKNTQINTASREQILLMLYDGAIRFMKQAKSAMDEDNYEKSHNKILRAQDIVTELMASLETDIMGETGDNLYQLYDYTLHNLVQANVDKDKERIDQALEVMEDLQQAWDEIINEQGMTYEKAKKQAGREDLSQEVQKPQETESSGDEASPEQTPKQTPKSSPPEDTPYGDISFQG